MHFSCPMQSCGSVLRLQAKVRALTLPDHRVFPPFRAEREDQEFDRYQSPRRLWYYHGVRDRSFRRECQGHKSPLDRRCTYEDSRLRCHRKGVQDYH